MKTSLKAAQPITETRKMDEKPEAFDGDHIDLVQNLLEAARGAAFTLNALAPAVEEAGFDTSLFGLAQSLHYAADRADVFFFGDIPYNDSNIGFKTHLKYVLRKRMAKIQKMKMRA